jgi:hypothetical protein
MSLHFNVYAPDGHFERAYQDMASLLAENQFMAHTDVSPDGVNRFEPADEQTEKRLLEMRDVIQGTQLNGDSLLIPMNESLLNELKYQQTGFDEAGSLYVRGEENAALFRIMFSSPDNNVCREGYTLTYDRALQMSKVSHVSDAKVSITKIQDVALLPATGLIASKISEESEPSPWGYIIGQESEVIAVDERLSNEYSKVMVMRFDNTVKGVELAPGMSV